MDRGVGRPPRPGPPSHRCRRRTTRALRLLPRLCRLPPRRVGARAGADHARPRRADRPVGPGSERAVRRPRGDLGRRPSHAPPRRATTSSTGSSRSRTRGCACGATRCSASSRASSTASTTPSITSPARRRPRAGSGSRRPRPTRLSSLGRAQCQAGDYETGAETLQHGDREGRGDRRRALGGARARAPGPGPARARAHRRGADGAGGGRGLPPRGGRRRAGGPRRHPAGRARRRPATPHGTARSSPRQRGRRGLRARRARPPDRRRRAPRAADQRMRAASHFITERDRTDADAARRRPAALP